MSPCAADLWFRAKDALRAGRHVLKVSPDTAASRAYYAAFYAVSALLALKDRTFRKHTAVESAVHRDLVRTGLWSEKLGEDYSRLARLRGTADYGDDQHASFKDAAEALCAAEDILNAVTETAPDEFGGLDKV
jgi:uncharacterized protein (UPF0332 family)